MSEVRRGGPRASGVGRERAETARRADVIILTALRLEYDAVLDVNAGAVQGTTWEHATGPSGLPLAFRSFEVPFGRPLRVAVAVAADMGATAAVNALLPLVDALKPRCIAMCGVCAGRPEKTQLGDVVAASRVFYHDVGKQLPEQVQHDLTTYQLRDDWRAALAGIDVVTRFRDADWFQKRPLTTVWRERRALVALHNGDAAPWHDLEPQAWAATVAALREQKLLAGRQLTDEGRRVVDDLLFSYQGSLPDLSPAGHFQPFRLHVGPLASGSQVIEDRAIWDSISRSVRTTLALEMEGAALGQLAHCQRQYGLDAVVMKGVMDFADRGRDDSFKAFAARASSECLLAFLRDHMPTELVAGFDDLLTTGTSPAPDHVLSPSSLLVARHTVVPWHDHGRAQILAELDAWADDPGRNVAVLLLHAAGGVGKTRLAIEWVRRRRERRDVAGFLGLRPGEDWLDRLCGLGAPVVIVLDYAESRADLVELLTRLARYVDASGPRRRVRMLLLARGNGDWWTELQARSDAIRALLSQTAPIALSPLAITALDRDAVFAEAAMVFAAVLGKPAVPRPPIALTDPRFERVLYLHMAALAAVEGVAFDAGTLMDVILDHEQRFWQTEAAALGDTAVNVELAQALVSAATLRGGIPTRDDAQDICCRLTRRPRGRDDDAMIAVLHRVYWQAGEPQYLPGLEPDLVGEAMVVRVAAGRQGTGAPARGAWIDRVFAAGDDERALTTAFTVLGRASAMAGSPIRPWIASLLETELPVRAVLALRAAKTVGQRTAFSLLGDVLAEALEQRGSEALANALDQEQLPYPTVSLQRVASWRSQRLLDRAGTGADESSMARRAQLSGQRGIDLAAAGQHEAALAATREAVQLYRQLATRDSDAFQPDLASSLNNLSVDLSNLGQRELALAAIREAVELRRQLATRNPDAFLPALAVSLNNLSKMLGDLGQREAALAAIREAVELRRPLAMRNPDAFQPDFATSLNNLGNRLSEMGQCEAALAATREAVELRRQLATRNPDAFQPDLASSLNNLGKMLSDLGQREDALAAIREAVELRRQLATRNPDAFQPDLAMSLNNLGNRLNELGQRDAALAASREAVALCRQLAMRNPDAFQPGLARSLTNLGNQLSELGQREDALVASREAVALYRPLAARNPDAFQPELAMSLNSLGMMLSELGQREDALAASREAVALYRPLVKRNPDAFQSDLAISLNNLGNRMNDLGQRDGALAAIHEAIELHRQLATRNPDAFQPYLAANLNNLGGTLIHLGQHEHALVATREAVALYRQLATRHPDAFQPNLAMSLNNLGNQLSELGQREDALAATREVVALRRQLATRHPEAFQPDLATSLNNLGKMLSHLGQRDETLAVIREAAALYRQLATRNADTFQPALATSLNNLAKMLSHLGQPDDALAAAREATEIHRRLATRNPETFLPRLMTSLSIYRDLLTESGDPGTAAMVADEAAATSRMLAREKPDPLQTSVTANRGNAGPSNPLSLATQFLRAAGFALANANEAIDFDTSSDLPFWRAKQVQPRLLTRVWLGKPLSADAVLAIRDAARKISSDVAQAFVVLDGDVKDEAWLQRAALRAQGFNLIPIPYTLVYEARLEGKPRTEQRILAVHLERFLGTGVDPYDLRAPVSDSLDFYGREAVADSLAAQLAAGKPIGLFGLRKIGKSSLLYYLQSRLPFPAARLDLQAGVDPVKLLQRAMHAWSADARARFDAHVWFSEAAQRDNADIEIIIGAIQEALGRPEVQLAGGRLAILLDEIEFLLPAGLDDEPVLRRQLALMRALRGLVQEDGRLSLLVVGVDPKIIRENGLEVWGEQNPFFQFIREIHLGPMLEVDCAQMIRSIGCQVDLKYTVEASRLVAAASGGHPFLARQLASLAFQRFQRMQLPGELGESDVRQALSLFLSDPRYTSYLADLWGYVRSVRLWGVALAIANENILTMLARADGPLSMAELVAAPDAINQRASLHELERRHVVQSARVAHDAMSASYTITFEMLKAWIRQYHLRMGGH